MIQTVDLVAGQLYDLSNRLKAINDTKKEFALDPKTNDAELATFFYNAKSFSKANNGRSRSDKEQEALIKKVAAEIRYTRRDFEHSYSLDHFFSEFKQSKRTMYAGIAQPGAFQSMTPGHNVICAYKMKHGWAYRLDGQSVLNQVPANEVDALIQCVDALGRKYNTKVEIYRAT